MPRPTPVGQPCKKGHPYDRLPRGDCRPCMLERSRDYKRKARAAKRLPRPELRVCGHPWSDRMRTKPDCASCNRARAKRYADAKRGGPPRTIDPERFPCGHSRLTETRPGKNTCAPCHKEAQKRRYHSDPKTHRRKAVEWQKANPTSVRERSRRFRERNPGYDAVRKYAPDPETREWLDVIAADPCAYCGGPSQAVDHIKPVSRGGANHWTNFTPSCRSCNSSKRDRELLQWLLAFRSAA